MLNEVEENVMSLKIFKFRMLNLYVEEKFKSRCNNIEAKY